MEKALALFGGSFDPLTNAHLQVIENLSARFAQVIVVPSHISPFKQDKIALSDQIRLKMLDDCCSSFANVEVSRFETDSTQVSYSYKTVAHYKQDGVPLYFVIGTDMIDGLDRWKEISKLCQNAIFYVIPRPFFEIDYERITELEDMGFRFKFADFEGLEGSSSLLKVARAFNRESEVAPQCVCDYIREHDLYADYEEIVKAYSVFNMKQSRIDHTYGAVKTGIILSKIYNANVEKVVRALLMHDIGKYVTAQDLEQMGIICSKDVDKYPESVRHCFTSRAIAEQYLKETDQTILDAIENHTTGRENMTMIEKIVFISDNVEEGRTFEGVEIPRTLAYVDIDQAICVALKQTVEYLINHNKEIDGRTLKTLEYYQK